MEAWARELLNNILEELVEEEFKHFKVRLEDEPPKIPSGRLEKLDKLHLARLMVQHYKPTEALMVAVNVLEKGRRMDLVERLRKESQDVPELTPLPGRGGLGESKGSAEVDVGSDLALLAAQLTPSPDVGSAEHDSTQLAMGSAHMDGQLIFNDCQHLKWVDWDGKIPDGAVHIENEQFSRIDYVSYGVSIGYYTPNKGPYCFYPLSDKELKTSSFQLLVNGGEFERLEWKAGSWGSIPENAIRCAPTCNTFVGRNKYGLGKVVTKFSAFFLPYDGKEICYKWYDVLTVCKDYDTQSISNVQYQMTAGKSEYGAMSILDESVMENRSSQEVKRTASFQKEIIYQHCWDTDHSAKAGVSLHFSAHSPIAAIREHGAIVLHERSQGTGNMSFKKSETKKVDEKIEVLVPPNHECKMVLQARKITVRIPYQATLTRTFRDGQIRSTTIQGLYTTTGFDSVGIQVKGCHIISD